MSSSSFIVASCLLNVILLLGIVCMTWGTTGDVGAPVAMRTSFNSLSAMHTPVFNGRDVSASAFRGVAKTRKAAAKRFKVTSGGKVLSKQAGKQHLNTKMSRKNKMRLGDKRVIEKADISNVQGLLTARQIS